MVLLDTSSVVAAFQAVVSSAACKKYPMPQVLIVAAAQLHMVTHSFRAACVQVVAWAVEESAALKLPTANSYICRYHATSALILS